MWKGSWIPLKMPATLLLLPPGKCQRKIQKPCHISDRVLCDNKLQVKVQVFKVDSKILPQYFTIAKTFSKISIRK